MANLLPQKQQRGTRQERRGRTVIVLCIFLLTIEVLGSVALVPSIFLAHSKRTNTMSQLGTVEALVSHQEGENISAEVRTTRNQLAELAVLTHQSPVTGDILAVTRQAHSGIRVESIVYQPTPTVAEKSSKSSPTTETVVMTIRGTATARETLLAFVRVLERTPRFAQVDLPVSHLAAKTDIPFLLTITLADTE
jgi:hypothetical protein